MGKRKRKPRQTKRTKDVTLYRVFGELHAADVPKKKIRRLVRRWASLDAGRATVTCAQANHAVVFPDHSAAAQARAALKRVNLITRGLSILHCDQGHVHLNGLAEKMEEIQ